MASAASSVTNLRGGPVSKVRLAGSVSLGKLWRCKGTEFTCGLCDASKIALSLQFGRKFTVVQQYAQERVLRTNIDSARTANLISTGSNAAATFSLRRAVDTIAKDASGIIARIDKGWYAVERGHHDLVVAGREPKATNQYQ